MCAILLNNFIMHIYPAKSSNVITFVSTICMRALR